MYRKYWERGYNVIALKPKSKRPVGAMSEWQKWSSERQPEDFIDYLEQNFPVDQGHNIGIILGKATGVMVIDNDSEIPEVEATLPLSNVCSRGQKGLSKFFKYFDGAYSKAYKFGFKNKWGKDDGFDILADSKYILVSPSIHPDTNLRYTFPTGEDNPLNIPPEELPEVGAWIYDMAEVLMSRFSKNKQGTITGGRNDTLVQIVSSMRYRGETELKITEEIYNYDKNNHKPRLFTDAEENFPALNENDAFNNAFQFQHRVTASLMRSRHNKLKIRKASDDFKILDSSKPLFEPRPLPKPSGFMKHVYDEIINSAYIPHENYALCGSLMLTATLACGRYHYMGNHPALYSMCIAGTGWGKEAPVKVLKRILTHERMKNYRLMGYGSYTSAQTLALRLPKQRSLLDILDEMGSFFRGQSQSKDNFSREITDELLKLFSNQGSFYHGKVSMKRKETGDCFSPFVNLMGFIQPELFDECVGQISVSQGFLPRFLIFNTEKHSNYNEDANDYVMNIDHTVGLALAKFPNENIFGISNAELTTMDADALSRLKPKPIAVMASNEFKAGIRSLGRDYSKLALSEENLMLAPFHTRVNELVKRVSLVHAVSDSRDSESICLNEENLEWAKNLIEALHYNINEKLKNLAPMSMDVKNSYKMLAKIKEIFFQTNQPVKPRQIYKAMHITKKQYEMYKDNLLAFGKVVVPGTGDNLGDALSPVDD